MGIEIHNAKPSDYPPPNAQRVFFCRQTKKKQRERTIEDRKDSNCNNGGEADSQSPQRGPETHG